MVMYPGKISVLTGAAIFAASAFAQVPTRDVDLQSGQAGGQSSNFNLQILEEVNALRREITELRETIDQQRFETERLRRDSGQAISELERELDTRAALQSATQGVDGGGTGEPGSESGAFAVGGGGAQQPGYDGVTSAPPVGASADTGTMDAGTEAILSNLYDGAAPEPAPGSALPATTAGTAPDGGAAPGQAQLRAEQAQFRAEQARLLEAQAQFLQEQARFRQEQARFLQEQAGGTVVPGADVPSSGQVPAQQPLQPQVQPQGQSQMPAPSQGALVPPVLDDAAGAEAMIGPASKVPGSISTDQGFNSPQVRSNAEDLVVPAATPGAIPSQPSLEMVIIDNGPASVDEPQQGAAVNRQNQLVNPFDLDEAPATNRDVSVSGGVYSSSLVGAGSSSSFSPAETDGSAVLAQRSLVTTQPNSILEVDIPRPRDESDSATTIAPNAIGTSAPPSADSFGFSTPQSGTAFGLGLSQNLPDTQGESESTFVIEDNIGEESGILVAAIDSSAGYSVPDIDYDSQDQTIVAGGPGEEAALTEVGMNSYDVGNDINTGQVPADAPPEPVPELSSGKDPEPQVVVLASPESPPPFTPAASLQREAESGISPTREPEVVMLGIPDARPPMTGPVDSPPPMTQTANYAPNEPAAQLAAVQSPATPVSLNSEEAQMYNDAFAFYQNRKYSKAIKGFGKQLKKYPNGTLAADAHYWSGEALFVTRSMVPAQQHMETILLEYGGSARAPDAMLTLAMIRKGQGQKDDASRIYRELIERFPGTQAAMSAQNNLASNR
jgi:tol-pal system protein YbgF